WCDRPARDPQPRRGGAAGRPPVAAESGRGPCRGSRGGRAMKVEVVFYGQARVAAGCERTTVEVEPGGTAGAAVLRAAEGVAALRDFLVDATGRPRRSVLLAVGQRQVSWDATDGLHDGDTVTVFPPIAGG